MKFNTKQVKKATILLIGTCFLAGTLFIVKHAFLPKEKELSIEATEEKLIEDALEKYLLKSNQDSYYSSGKGTLFCSADLRWMQDISETEKIVYADSNCANVVKFEGDLRSESGGGSPPLFKIEKKNNTWVVIDSDNRTVSPNEPITQDWVKEAEKNIPTEIKNQCSPNCFSTSGLIEKAAKYYNVALPNYPLNSCTNTSDCAKDALCVLSGTHSNAGKNTCVKKCETNRECGVAHTCRYQCINGENGCPETAEKICIPDMLHIDVKKDPDSFVGFDDFDITRRQAIEESYPEFVVKYEKQPCFAGCSVKVVEDNRNYYYAYITYGSGVPIAKATCFRVSPLNPDLKVTKIGEFPMMTDSYYGYMDIDPKTCMGMK